MKNQMTLFLQLDLGIIYNILKIIALSADKVIGGRFSKNFRNTHDKLMELLCNKTATTSLPTTEAPCSQALPPTLYCETTSIVLWCHSHLVYMRLFSSRKLFMLVCNETTNAIEFFFFFFFLYKWGVVALGTIIQAIQEPCCITFRNAW